MPGNDGADSDAMGAYTQTVHLGEETWVRIPPYRQPSWWKTKFEDPVVRLRLNLYGHPLAGLYWEKHCKEALFKCGFEPVRGWECLYKHPKEKLFLSVYVDDFKMAGKAEALEPMWKRIGKLLDLEPPTPLTSNVYLGCGQNDTHMLDVSLANKIDLYDKLFADNVHGKKHEGCYTPRKDEATMASFHRDICARQHVRWD